MYVFGGYTDHNHNDTFQYHFGTAPLCSACRVVRVRVRVRAHLTTRGRRHAGVDAAGVHGRGAESAIGPQCGDVQRGHVRVWRLRWQQALERPLQARHQYFPLPPQAGSGNGGKVAADVSWLWSVQTC